MIFNAIPSESRYPQGRETLPKGLPVSDKTPPEEQPLKLYITESEWITTAQAAAIMEISISMVSRLCRNEKITCRKFGQIWQVNKQDAHDYIRRAKSTDQPDQP